LNPDTKTCVLKCSSILVGNNNTRTCNEHCANTNEYGDPIDRICKLCSPNCLTCVDTSTTCQSCFQPKYLDSLTSSCVLSCPSPKWGVNITRSCEDACTLSSQYGDSTDNRICKACDPNCLTCVDTSITCTSCSSPNYLDSNQKICVTACVSPYWGNNASRTCDSSCSLTSQYGDEGDKRICKNCDLTCKTCIGTSTHCTSCDSPRFLHGPSNTCLTQCPDPTWGDSSTKICVDGCPLSNQYGDRNNFRICTLCTPNCHTCDNSANECTSCSAPYYLDANLKTCVASCPVPLLGKRIKYFFFAFIVKIKNFIRIYLIFFSFFHQHFHFI
jgi:proprotein convertase subtilisin/kexin type 5